MQSASRKFIPLAAAIGFAFAGTALAAGPAPVVSPAVPQAVPMPMVAPAPGAGVGTPGAPANPSAVTVAPPAQTPNPAAQSTTGLGVAIDPTSTANEDINGSAQSQTKLKGTKRTKECVNLPGDTKATCVKRQETTNVPKNM